MGLLDDVFGRNEINQLKTQLIEKNNQLLQLENVIVDLKSTEAALTQKVSGLQEVVAEKESALNSLTREHATLQRNHEQLRSEVVDLRQKSTAQELNSQATVSELQVAIAAIKAESAAVKNERDAMAKDLASLKSLHAEKEIQFQTRENKLAEKSEKLQQERQRFQQQANELHTREQHWKQQIEPQIKRYAAHAELDVRQQELDRLQTQLSVQQRSIEEREADMVRRQCLDEALRRREVEINEWEHLLSARQSELDVKAAHLTDQLTEIEQQTQALDARDRTLSAFSDRVKKIDEDDARIARDRQQLEARQLLQQAQHAERLAEVRQQRSELRHEVKELNRRELELKTREKEVKREEAASIAFKNKNFDLRKEQKVLKLRIESLEADAQQATALKRDLDALKTEHKALQESYKIAQANAKDSAKAQQEINRLTARIKQLSETTLGSTKFNSSLSNPTVLAWVLEDAGPDATGIENGWLGSSGEGPWTEQSLESCLYDLGYRFYPLPDADLEHIIVGRKGWSKTDLLKQIEARDGQPLRIYSEEMFFLKLVTGRDPFDEDDEALMEAFAEDHPALQFLMTLSFPWPTVSIDEPGPIKIVGPGEDKGVSESPLHILGYKVGATSDLSISERRKILTQCFEAQQLEFSPDSDDEYIAKWGRARGAQRLYRMAIHIKTLADGRVGKDYRKPQARIDWIRDLNWLKEKFYPAHKVRFEWP